MRPWPTIRPRSSYYRCQPAPDLLGCAARGRGELLDRDGIAVGEKPKQRDQQAGIEAGLLGPAEPLGQSCAEIGHCGFLQFWVRVFAVFRTGHAQQDSLATSAVKALATIRMPSAMVR